MKYYIVVNKFNEIYIGTIKKTAVWSEDWDHGMPLLYEQAKELKKQYPNTKVVKCDVEIN